MRTGVKPASSLLLAGLSLECSAFTVFVNFFAQLYFAFSDDFA